ncbi:hypothetical protein NMG60_11028493 [Bertholletia excelsa]
MEKAPRTPPKTPVGSENVQSDPITPPESQQSDRKSRSSGHHSCISGATPDRLKVPKALKYPERYTSPTDLMVSPISKGLLARSRRKPGVLLPPTINQTKEGGLFQA